MIDIVDQDVEITFAKDALGWKVWVNTRQGCQFRAYRIPRLAIEGLGSLDESLASLRGISDEIK
jgi:hypothetical protein